MLPAWLNSIHHDGSTRYVSNMTPQLGDKVTLRLRISTQAPVRQVYLRTFPDGEQAFTPMQTARQELPVYWWQVELPVTQPVTHYRFLLLAEDGVWWYAADGAHAHNPLDSADFQILAGYQSLDWIYGSVFYQIFPDRFANGDPSNDPQPEEFQFRGYGPRTFEWGEPPESGQPFPLVFYGGDLPGITQRLDYLEWLGVNGIYLNPIFTAFSNHKYDVVDYEHVDPHFGGDEALAELRQELTHRNMRYLLDIVPNHCGYWHPWFQAARADLNAPEAEFFTFRQHPDQYESWLGVWTLPKLNYQSAELRRRIFAGEQAVFRRWLRPPFSADGWRVDVANMLARQGVIQNDAEIARQVRQAVKDTRPEAYLIGENFFDASRQLQGDQYDGVMNYMGFSIPLTHWLSGFRQGAHGLAGQIVSPAPFSTAALEATWRTRRAAIPWVINLQQYNLLGSHDTSRIRTLVGDNLNLVRLATLVLFTFPGVPGLYYGDEIGLSDDEWLKSRNCMPWDESGWDFELLEFHRQLIALRRKSAVLQTGGFQVLHTEADLFAYQRDGANGEVALVIANRSPQSHPAFNLAVAHGGLPDGTRLTEFFSGQVAVVRHGALPLPELPQGATLWLTTAFNLE